MGDAVQEKYVVESALFSAGKPLSPEEIAEATDLTLAAVKKHIQELSKEYKEREGSIEISQVGSKYAMQLRPSYAVHASKLAQMEIPPKVLKTVALIAYHQPVTQSNLKRLLGGKVYEHVDVLDQLGLIRTRKIGQTKVLTTTPRFCEYFGISEVSKDGVKSWLAKKVGVKTGTGTIEEFLDKLDNQSEGGQVTPSVSPPATNMADGSKDNEAEHPAKKANKEQPLVKAGPEPGPWPDAVGGGDRPDEVSKEAPKDETTASEGAEEEVVIKDPKPPADDVLSAPTGAEPASETRTNNETKPTRYKGKSRSKKGKKK